jgi:hypothetical protein
MPAQKNVGSLIWGWLECYVVLKSSLVVIPDSFLPTLKIVSVNFLGLYEFISLCNSARFFCYF